jgi:hypothetical protein
MPLKIEMLSFFSTLNEVGASVDNIAVEPKDLILDLTYA